MLVESKTKTKIIAHRGASHAAPENTLPAFELAFREKADLIEGDFRMTKDGEIVCIHDLYTKRTESNSINLNVQKSNYSDLYKLDFGAWKSQKYSGTQIPTLTEILDIIPEEKGIVIEIKDSRTMFVHRLKELLRNSKLPPDKIVIIAFDPKVISNAKKYLPEYKAYWLYNWYFSAAKNTFSNTDDEIIKVLKILNCDGIDINISPMLSVAFVEKLRENNFDFFTYTTDKIEDAVRLLTLGVDGITTNSPLRLRKAIEIYFEIVPYRKSNYHQSYCNWVKVE